MNRVIGSIIILMLVLYSSDTGYSYDIFHLRVPMKSRKLQRDIVEVAEAEMHPWWDTGSNWGEFNKIVRELKDRDDIDLMVVAGVDADIETIEVDYECSYRDGPSRLIKAAKAYLPLDSIDEEYFVANLLENSVRQHVQTGIALVVREKKENYIKISVIDNGPGFINQRNGVGERIPIKLAIESGRDYSFGKNGEEGIGLADAVGIHADICEIEQPTEYAIIKNDEFDPYESKIVFNIRTNKPYGTSIIGYFYTESTDPKDIDNWEDRRIAQLKQKYFQKSVNGYHGELLKYL